MKTTMLPVFFLLLLIPFSGFSQTELEKRSFISNRVELLAPKNFQVMSDKMMEKKYPNRKPQPDVVLTDENAEVNLVAVYTQQAISDDQLEAYKNFQISSLSTNHPDAKWIHDGIRMINNKRVGYFKFMSAAADQRVYNYYFFTEMGGRVLLFTFNCTEKLLPKWRETAEAIVSSLKIH